ncbi:TlpA family protein disulfide reductase [Nocardia sp. NPDC051570]|uniref:TlpA family protein disulfide reductase n=1 Tax=Nocardia sp. NPDC051570 TaxID=3364324 RepID=UPI0037B55B6D
MTTPWIVAFIGLVVLVAALTLVVLGMISRGSAALERLEHHVESLVSRVGPVPGTPLPDIAVTDPSGTYTSLAALRGTPFVLLVVRSGCPACQRLLDNIGNNPDTPAVHQVILLTDTATGDEPTHAPLPGWITTLHSVESISRARIGVDRTPMAIAFAPNGTVVEADIPASVHDLHVLATRIPAATSDTESDLDSGSLVNIDRSHLGV